MTTVTPVRRLLHDQMAVTPDIVTKRKSKRLWFQFSLGTVLALTTVFGIWLGWRVKKARDQEAAVTAIQDAGGRISYDYERDKRMPPAPEWLRRLAGIDFSAKVVNVGADHSDVGGSATITDAEMVHFSALRDLQYLNLEGQKEVTDVGVAHLNGLKKLETLYLLDSNVTDHGLRHLSTLTNLNSLELAGMKIGDAGLAHLSNLTSLHNLSLSNTQISDAGLVHLLGLKNIKQLDLTNTSVSDAGLPHLRALTTLKVLGLTKTHVSARGVRQLQKSLPNCTIGR